MQRIKSNYAATRRACYLGYVTQAIVNNLLPLFFVILNEDYGLDLTSLGSLILFNFLFQLAIDLLAVRYVDRIGYRRVAVGAHVFAVLGLTLLALLPQVMSNTWLALLIAIAFLSVGGGLIEVLISPIVDQLPSDQRAADMGLLHSFYCWGMLAVIIVSTLLLSLVGSQRWYLIPLFWAILPLANALLFSLVPIIPPDAHAPTMRAGELLRQPALWLLMLLMFASGASEQVIAQWSSLFVERGFGLTKVMGDLLGPALFALFMALGRMFMGRQGAALRLRRALLLGCGLLTLAYILLTLWEWPGVALAGFALGGLGVSVMWPGVTSLGSRRFPRGGTALFGLIAISGDLGCAIGPWLTSQIADINMLFGVREEAALARSVGTGIIFPLLLGGGILYFTHRLRSMDH